MIYISVIESAFRDFRRGMPLGVLYVKFAVTVKQTPRLSLVRLLLVGWTRMRNTSNASTKSRSASISGMDTHA